MEEQGQCGDVKTVCARGGASGGVGNDDMEGGTNRKGGRRNVLTRLGRGAPFALAL